MKIERTKNAGRNIIFGGILKIYQIFIPFLMRTAMIYFMGVQYLGLSSLFTSILQVLNLAELGVGGAMVYAMYKPITEDDTKTICALMKLYRTYYRCIGGVIAVIGLCLTPVIPKLIKSDLPMGLNVYALYLLNLFATVLSYWLFAYKNSIFQAYQRVDIISKVSLITNTLQYMLQLIIIVFVKNYYIYVIVALATQALNNIITALIATKKYPDYKPVGRLDKKSVKEINSRIRDLFTSKLGMVIVNSADTVVISAFLGLTVLAIYQNYYFILTAIIGLVDVIFQACTAGIGNSVIVETKKKNFDDLKKFTLMIVWIAGFCTCCFLNLYQPFMEIWVGKDLMLNFGCVVCLCIYYFIYEINKLLNTYKDASGIWHEDRFRPLITALTNLALNILTVNFLGIYGVLLSTVVSTLVIGMPWLLHNLFTVLFDKEQLREYLIKLSKYLFVVCISCVITLVICNIFTFSKWITLIIRGMICCVVPNIIYWVSFKNIPEFEQCTKLLKTLVGSKIKYSNK